MKVEFGCPACGAAVELAPGTAAPCRRCGAEAKLPPAAPGRPEACLACGCTELYRHRDFNQRLGLGIVALGVLLWLALGSFWPMVVAAALDLFLYLVLPDVAICYRCKAHHREFEGIAGIPPFDLERHEHYRHQPPR